MIANNYVQPLPHVAAAMLLAVVALTGTGGAATSSPGPDLPRVQVVGGHDAEPGAWPWQVGLYQHLGPDDGVVFACGGTLIDPEWVMTAAHCVVDRASGTSLSERDLEVGVGMHDLAAGDGRRVAVAQSIPHPDYDQVDLSSDIALLRLKEPVETDEHVRPAALLSDSDDPVLTPGQGATVTGWGRTDPDEPDLAGRLQQAELQIVDCESVSRRLERSVCTRGGDGVDACHGDSGGPLVVQVDGAWRQAGITSWGARGPSGKCGGPSSISVFTRVPDYSEWVARTMADRRPMIGRVIEAPTVVAPGGHLTYRITLRNTGRSAAEGLVVRSHVPRGVKLLATDPGLIGRGDVVEWVIVSLPADSEVSGSYVVRDQVGVALDRPPARLGPSHDAVAQAPGGGARPNVVGGEDAADDAWPWHAAVFYQDRLACGGSLINNQWVLTSAYCLEERGGTRYPSRFAIEVGTTRHGDEGQRIAASTLYQHGGWSVGAGYDIGLIKLARPVRPSASVRPAPLADDDEPWISGGQSGILTGWGVTDPHGPANIWAEDLQQVELEIPDRAFCRGHTLGDWELCAGPPDGSSGSCLGDEGGPFVVGTDHGYSQIGIAGPAYVGCPGPDRYSRFTRVAPFKDWIVEKLLLGHPDKIIVNDRLDLTSSNQIERLEFVPAMTYVGYAPGARPAAPFPLAFVNLPIATK